MRLSTSVALLFSVLLLVAGPVAPAEPIPNSSCLDCHSDNTLTKTNAAGREISLFVDEAKLAASAHGTNTCHACHSDLTAQHPDDEVPAKPVNCASCHPRQSELHGASVHGTALARGEPGAATCADCHGTHEIMHPTAPTSPLHFSRLAETCGACHDEAARDVAASVHGEAIAKGHREAPTCTDCHAEHGIVELTGEQGNRRSADVCSNCHASERLNTKYNLPGDRVKTFFESYHGLAAQYGSTLAANCSSCHGVHKILPSTNPDSTIHASNLVETCGKCHPGASENFALSKVHVDIETAEANGDIGQKASWWVRRIYLVLIFGVIGSMLVHNGLLFGRKVAAKYRAADLSVPRMDRSQRTQHFLLAATFIVLAVTGFALKFPESWVSKILGSNEAFRSWSHRIAGVVMLLAGFYHVYYVVFKREGRRLLKDLLPVPKDVADVAQNARFLTGLSSEKARIGRFGYSEKMEYWAVVWGTIIMGVTGLMIWFKIDVTQFLPRWAVDVATTIHYYEAVLACLAIVVWHFYHVMFDPDVYPMNWAAFNGKVTRHWHDDEHPLENDEETQPKPPSAKPKSTTLAKH